MSVAPYIADCTGTCSSNGSSDPSSNCAAVRKSKGFRAVRLGAGFLTLCAICCVVPPVLIALGFLSISTAAYFSAGSTVALIVLAALGLGYLSVRYVKKKW